MTALRPVCAVEIVLTDAELSALAAMPSPAHELVDTLRCELEAGHSGEHLALGQESIPSDEVWLRWRPAGSRELLRAPECCDADEDPEDSDDPRVCELPAGHPGVHTFHMEQGGGGGREASAYGHSLLDEAIRRVAEDAS